MGWVENTPIFKSWSNLSCTDQAEIYTEEVAHHTRVHCRVPSFTPIGEGEVGWLVWR